MIVELRLSPKAMNFETALQTRNRTLHVRPLALNSKAREQAESRGAAQIQSDKAGERSQRCSERVSKSAHNSPQPLAHERREISQPTESGARMDMRTYKASA